MKRILFFFISIKILTSFLSCTTGDTGKFRQIKVQFPSCWDTVNFHPSENSIKVLYYFNGNCSGCYMTLSQLDQEYNDREIIGITPSWDTALILYQMQLLNNNFTILHDKDSSFYVENKKLLDSGNILLIDSNNYLEKNYFY